VPFSAKKTAFLTQKQNIILIGQKNRLTHAPIGLIRCLWGVLMIFALSFLRRSQRRYQKKYTFAASKTNTPP